MNIDQKSKIRQIINHYGNDHQRMKAVEELTELAAAVARGADRSNIAEEIADVTIMLEQIMQIFDIVQEEIEVIIDYKINRQLARISVPPSAKKSTHAMSCSDTFKPQQSAGVDLPKKPVPKRKPVDTGKIKALREAGWAVSKIADEMGVTETAIYNHLKKIREEERIKEKEKSK